MIPGPRQLSFCEIYDFSMGMGSCYILMGIIGGHMTLLICHMIRENELKQEAMAVRNQHNSQRGVTRLRCANEHML